MFLSDQGFTSNSLTESCGNMGIIDLLLTFSLGTDDFFWDDPRKVGVKVTEGDGSEYFRGPGAGTAVFLTQARALSRDFIKGGDAIFLLTMEGEEHTAVHNR
ncbi:hypothetical protein M9458_002810 [Cirrhinus mrigala]|uniref:Uncharacterized protein n=1 Tax=Cirrhinus mrigala TaxID=683832 RepID=A0ABD0RP70_CIRMR